MKKNDLINLNRMLTGMKDTKGNVKFAYGVTKNLKLILNEVDILKELENDIKSMIDPYREERDEIIIRLGKENNTGGFSIDMEDKDAVDKFNKDVKALGEKYKEVFEQYNKRVEDFGNILEEEVDIELFKMNIDYFPDEISPSQIETLMDCGILE